MTATPRGSVKLGDHELRFGINQMCQVEAELGKSLIDVFNELQAKPDMTTFRHLFAIGLGLDPEAAGEVVDAAGGLSVAGSKLGDAIKASFPDLEIEGSDKGPSKRPRTAARAGTG